MKNFIWTIKLFIITLSFLFFFSSFATEYAYARGGGGGGGGGGCFDGETLILTPVGNKKISQLHPGDRIIGYDFSTHHQQEEVIGDVRVLTSPDYYLINDRIKVTGGHPFYLGAKTEIKLTEVKNIKKGDRLIDKRGNSSASVKTIEHITKPIVVYNLISINPNHNFYANGFLVHNKGGGGGSNFIVGRSSGSGGQIIPLNKKTIFAAIESFLILIAGLLSYTYWRPIYNYIRFFNRTFSNDSQLIQFTIEWNSNFKNKYSIWYISDRQNWKIKPKQTALEEDRYQHLIDRLQLEERVSNLFLKYQQDWMAKNFNSMKKYIVEPFYSQQKRLLQENFGNNIDLIYAANLPEIIPIDIEQQEDGHIFKIQIDAEMINFTLTEDGYILSGKPNLRSFTEYWDVGLSAENNWYLLNISQFFPSDN